MVFLSFNTSRDIRRQAAADLGKLGVKTEQVLNGPMSVVAVDGSEYVAASGCSFCF
jgi:hypothetical protein